MSRSYKLCPVDFLDDSSFSLQPLRFGRQIPLPEIPQEPHTSITKLRSDLGVQDFRSYAIEHEREVAQRGRFNDQQFTKYIQTAEIAAFYSSKRSLLILSGRKNDVLDFCSRNRDTDHMRFTTINVDMNALLEKLSQVRLVWFRHDGDPSIHASALMGQHIEKTTAFQDAKNGASISTLSFFIEDSAGNPHCVLVTSDGTIVPQGHYDPAFELELVLFTKDSLLNPIISPLPFERTRRR